MESRTASTAGAGLGARLVATVAVLFAALVLFTPTATRAATSAQEAGHHPASAVTVLAADQHMGTLRLDLPQLPSAPPPLAHQARASLHTADTSSTTFVATAETHRTRGPPPDDHYQ